MKIIKVENAAVGSHKAYNLLVQGLQTQARVLGLATGSNSYFTLSRNGSK